jgi:DNA-binding XRE family transcriptional regulator
MNDDDQNGFYQEVGRRIREARRRRRPALTQEALANLVSLTRTSITNVEKGRQKFLLHTLVDIASALQVQPSSLLPDSKTEVERLDAALKYRTPSEQEWIKSTITAVEMGRIADGS